MSCKSNTLHSTGQYIYVEKIVGQFLIYLFFKVEAYNTEHHFEQELSVQ